MAVCQLSALVWALTVENEREVAQIRLQGTAFEGQRDGENGWPHDWKGISRNSIQRDVRLPVGKVSEL